MYFGGYGGLSESGLCVISELCQVGFLVVCESPSVLLLSCRMLIVVSGLMIVRVEASYDTAYKQCSVTAITNCCANRFKTFRPQKWGGGRFIFLPCGPAGWLALLLTKAGVVETNPGPTTLNKQVWICDICHKQIHARKQISIRCNRIEHWVHLRCAGIQAKYTDTWTCHLHR